MADTTPDPRTMTRIPAKQTFPRDAGSASAAEQEREPVIAERPPLPEHTPTMAADIEDEEADPVVDTGPGIADGALNRK